MQVSFVCQRCCQPLKLDTSFNVLDRVTVQELTGSCIEAVVTIETVFLFCLVIYADRCVPLLSLAPLVTVTPSKRAESSEGEPAPEVSPPKHTRLGLVY